MLNNDRTIAVSESGKGNFLKFNVSRKVREKGERVKRELVLLSQALMRDTKILVEEEQADGTMKPCMYLKSHTTVHRLADYE